MLHRILIILSWALVWMGVPGCGWYDSEFPFDLDVDLYVAQDVEAAIRLGYPTELGARPISVLAIKASKDSGLKWREVHADGLAIQLDLTGTDLGDHELHIRYRDDDGRKRQQTFIVHVMEHHHSTATIDCDTPGLRAPYFVAAGEPFRLRVTGRDVDGHALPMDGVLLVKDAGGLDRAEEGRDLWIAPEEPGSYTLTLVGQEEREFTIVVYEPHEILPSITIYNRATTERPKVQVDLGPALQDEEGTACILPSERMIDVEASAGDCLVVAGLLAFEDGLSIDVSSGPAELGIVGQGECALRARSGEGGNVEVTLNVDVAASSADPQLANYRALGGNALEVVPEPDVSIDPTRPWAACGDYTVFRASTECDRGYYLRGVEGAGCVPKVGWSLSYMDLDEEVEYAGLGVGLLGELDFRLEAKGNDRQVGGIDMPPIELTISPSFELLSWTDLGCTETKRVYQVKASGAGSFEVDFDARNATEERELTVRAYEIAETRLVVTGSEPYQDLAPDAEDSTDDALGSPPAWLIRDGASVRHVFLGELRTVELHYFNAEGERLRGVGSISVSSSEEDSEAAVEPSSDWRSFGVFTGTEPSQIEVRAPQGPGSDVIFAEGADGIAGIHGLDVVRLRDGQKYCVSLLPLAEDGLLISGPPPVPAQVRGTRGALTVLLDKTGDTERTCFSGRTPGDVELDWSWGSARANVTWTVE